MSSRILTLVSTDLVDSTELRWLREAHRLFTEMGATEHAERLAKELGRGEI